ncbi:MAG TPA: glycosyltransferase family 2 protein [Mucilaginibacter sp.]
MSNLKISLITVSYNAESTISRCIESVIRQNFKNIEYIIVDGGSTDQTAEIVKRYSSHINLFISEADNGVYDGMNKGIRMASGNIIGMLNADDFFADDDVLSMIDNAFGQQRAEIVYGDLDYIDSSGKTIRKWRSGKYSSNRFNYGWMPPHPTFYCKRSLFEKFGFYSLNYGTAADYELMLRFMYLKRVNAYYLKKVMIKMNIGGMSNKNIGNRVKGLAFDFKAMRNNDISLPLITLIFKPLRKVVQYF